MKEKIKRFWNEHRKPIVGGITLVVIAVGILIVSNLGSKQNTENTVSETGSNEMISDKEVKPTEIPVVKETPQVEETQEPVKETLKEPEEKPRSTPTPTSEVIDSEPEKPDVTKKPEKDTTSEVKTTKKPTEKPTEKPTKKPAEKPTTQSEPAETKRPNSETKYIPISKGWKAEASAKGDITSAQKAKLDSMIQTWKSGALTDTELKEKIISYLEEQKIDYMEVSVTSKGYALFEKVPEIDLRDGGNLYSFVGTYSTGKQNPDGTNKTVCYNWSAFVF